MAIANTKTAPPGAAASRVDCPHCAAPAGQRCRTKAGARMTSFHKPRWTAVHLADADADNVRLDRGHQDDAPDPPTAPVLMVECAGSGCPTMISADWVSRTGDTLCARCRT